MEVYNVASPPHAVGHVPLPPGWLREYSSEHARYYYINTNTKETTWAMPVVQEQPPVEPVRQMPQRKPVPNQVQVPQQTAPYPTPPLQSTTGYFSPAPVEAQQQPQPNMQQQQYYQYQNQAQYSQPQTSERSQQGAYGGQQYPLTPPSLSSTPGSTPSSQFAMSPAPMASPVQYAAPQPPQGNAQVYFPPPPTQQQPNYAPTAPNANLQEGQMSPPMQNQGFHPQQQVNPYGQPQAQPQGPQYQQRYQPQAHAQPQHQQQQNLQPYTQAQPHQPYAQLQPTATTTRGPSTTGSNFMSKMSSKLSHYQQQATTIYHNGQATRSTNPPTRTNPTVNPSSTAPLPSIAPQASTPTDWKKWSKRAAIGLGAVGAVALGMDAMDGGLIDGSGGGGGGGSWSDWGFGGGGAGDAAGVMDAQTAVDANAMQHAIAGMGQDNASMLLDPVGTQYVVVGGGAASGNPALDLI